MPLRLDIKRKLTARSDRVKSADLHPTEPWMVVSLYSGTLVVWNFESQAIVKTFELCDLPVRVAKFIARKHWLIAGADDMQIRVFNYNTLERVYMFEAHSDYIRCIAVHPTQPYILTSSDDMLIKLWDWEKKWVCSQVFEGHTHYVMQIVINPKDNNQFASASLDRTIKVWQLGSKTPNFTLEGHEKGVNCIDYYSGGDKPYLISGADDRLVKIWDYQNKTCVQTLEGHAQNVTCVNFHPELPIILTGSEDGTVRLWHSNTYRLENTLNYGMERAWCISGQQGSNSVAIGYDEGSIIIKLGREEPAMSMDSSGKIMWARHSEVQQANLKAMGDAEVKDGERLPLGIKDMGSCEIYPQSIQHSPNGRFVVVCGDGEYIIYTAMALRNKSFGAAQEFAWAHDSSQYAVREGNSMVKIFKNFKQKKAFKPDFGAEGIFGGFLLGVRSNSGLAFFDWESSELIRRIEIQPKHIFWSDSGELVCIATDESYFLLRYLPERVLAAQESKQEMAEDGIEDAFEVLGEVQETVKTGLWVGDCFIYTSSVNRLNYYVGGEIITIAHMDRTMYLLGYIPKDDRLYLGDKELNVISYSLLLSMLEYQTAVMRKDFSTADKVLPTIPKEQRTRVALFLEKQGFNKQALAVSTDPEHKFELALQLGELKTAYQLAQEAESEHKWKQLAELATAKCQFSLAQECLHQAQDYGGLLLLATTSGNAGMVGKLAEGAERDGKTNVAFLTYFMQGRVDKCLELLIKTDRLPEAAFLARTYLPSQVPRVVKLWKEGLSKVNQKAADALADPTQYSNLFPGLQQALLAEQYLKETHVRVRPAAEYPLITPNEDRNVLEESAGFMPNEEISGEEEVMESMEEQLAPSVASSAAAAAVEEPVPPALELVDTTATVDATAALRATALQEVAAAPIEVSAASQVFTAAPPEVTAGPEVLSAGPEALTVGPEALTVGPEVLSVGPEVLTAASAVLTAASPEITADSEALTAGPEVLSVGPEVLTAATAVLTAALPDFTGGPEALSAGPEVLTAASAVLTAALPDFTAGPEALSAGPEALTVGPEALSVGPEVLTAASAVLTAALPDLTVPEKQVDPADFQSASSEMTTASVTNILQEPLIDIPTKVPEMLEIEQLGLEEDASASVESEAQETSLEAPPAAAGDAGSKASAEEDVLVSAFSSSLTIDAATTSGSGPTEEETDLMSSEIPQMTSSAAAEEDLASPGLIRETAPSHVTVDELISFEASAMDAPVPGQTLSGLVFDPLLESLEDPIKPAQAQELARDGLAELMLPGTAEDKWEPLVVPQLEPEASSLLEKVAAAKEECEEPAEDLGAELSDEGLDDLDLDNFDLEDIDTTDVNLDEDFLGE